MFEQDREKLLAAKAQSESDASRAALADRVHTHADQVGTI